MAGATKVLLTVNLVNTIIGAGMLAMPYAFKNDGWVLGVIITMFAGAASGYGLYLQTRVAKYVPQGHATFFLVCQLSYPQLSVVFDIAIAIQCFGVALLYLVLTGDLMPEIVGYGLRTDWILASLVVTIPLCLFKNLDLLKYTLVLALAAIAYMVVLVVGHFVANDVPVSHRGATSWGPTSVSGLLSTFLVIVLAFTGHQNMFTVINEAADKLVAGLLQVVAVLMWALVGLFLLVGMTGYAVFGDKAVGNVMVMFDRLPLTVLGQGALVLMVMLSYPLMFHPCRVSINNIYFWVRTKVEEVRHRDKGHVTESALLANSETGADGYSTLVPTLSQQLFTLQDRPLVAPLTNATFYGLTVVMLVACYALALLVSLFALVLAVVGATGSTSILFILPGLFGFKLVGGSVPPVGVDEPLWLTNSQVKWSSLALAVWGVVVMVVCLYTTLVAGA